MNIFLLKVGFVLCVLCSFVFSEEIRINDDFKKYFKGQKSLRVLKNKNLKPTEQLLFDLNWGFINAGQATLELLESDDDSLWVIRSRAWCNGFFQTFYPVQDTIVSIIDKQGFYPLHYEKNIHEGGYHANIVIRFDQKNKKSYIQSNIHHKSEKSKDTILTIFAFTHDILSSFYFLRMIDFEVGKTVSIDVVSGAKQYSLEVFCHRKEKVTVDAGSFNTFVIEPRIKGVGIFNSKGSLHIWITDDSSHIPVKMRTKIPVGSIEAVLIKITQT